MAEPNLAELNIFDSPIQRIEDPPYPVGRAPAPRDVNVGTTIRYFPGVHDELNRDRRDTPLAAIVTRVNADQSLNLLVGDVLRGKRFQRNQVRNNPQDPDIEGYWGFATVPSPVIVSAFSKGFKQDAFQ